MLIKWIKCKVLEDRKPMFSIAQEKWIALKGFNGFLGQIGGWNLRNPLEACIISFWNDEYSYQTFMKQKHDEIFEKSEQPKTYYSISVKIYEKKLGIYKEKRILIETLLKSKTVRVIECMVNQQKQENVELLQREMVIAEDKDMLFFQNKKQNNHFLIVSRWGTKDGAKKNQLTFLETLTAENEALQISETLVALENSWAVF